MKRQHLLQVDAPLEVFAPLIAACARAGLRAGWLELEAPSPLPAGLEAAASAGVLRAVAAGGGRSLALKPLRGEPVLRDLQREHFRGCALVLVRAEIAAPRLDPIAGGWAVVPPAGPAMNFDTEELLEALRKPHPWRQGADTSGAE